MRGIPEFLEISYRNFPLHLTYLREFTFKFFRQFSEFLETFPASFSSICPRLDIFGILVEWKVLDVHHVHICFTVNIDLQLWVENVKNVLA